MGDSWVGFLYPHTGWGVSIAQPFTGNHVQFDPEFHYSAGCADRDFRFAGVPLNPVVVRHWCVHRRCAVYFLTAGVGAGEPIGFVLAGITLVANAAAGLLGRVAAPQLAEHLGDPVAGGGKHSPGFPALEPKPPAFIHGGVEHHQQHHADPDYRAGLAVSG